MPCENEFVEERPGKAQEPLVGQKERSALSTAEDLTMFLQSDNTFEEILKIAHRDQKDIVVRRYVTTCTRLLQPVSIL